MSMRVYELEECGADGYPPEWHETLKHEVRDRAGHRCVRCGHPYRRGEHGRGEWSPCDEWCCHGGLVRVPTTDGGWTQVEVIPGEEVATMAGFGRPVEAAWRILTVHHLDGNKANCRWWNLAALCQRCHLQVQGRVRMERVYPWPHSRWFKPYVAGYYAWTYLGEDLDRPTVEARLDELLGLELAA